MPKLFHLSLERDFSTWIVCLKECLNNLNELPCKQVLPFNFSGWVLFLFLLGQFSSVAQLCLTLSDPMDCSTPGFPVHLQLRELTQTHVHWVGDAIQPSCPLSSPSPPAFNLSQHQVFFSNEVSSSHQVAKVLELQHQSLQWIFRTDFL